LIELLKIALDPLVIGSLSLMSFLVVWAAVERLIFLNKVDLHQYTHVKALNIDLTKNLTLISTIAANAPYVGLAGTVGGILLTFHEIGANSGQVSVENIMVGLALALKATALGLVVAIPAVLFYNGLLRKVEVVQARWEVINDSIGE